MKKLLYLIIAVIIVVVIVLLCNTENKNKENTVLTNSNIIENEKENKIEENEIVENEIENEVLENEIQIENEIDSETFEEEPKTEKDKAKDIVVKDWGNTSNIEISIDGINQNGSYIVTVRDSKSTEALAFYTVNVKDGTFNKKEMN